MKSLLIGLFVIFTFLFWIARLYRLDELSTFHLDQALQISETKQMVDSKIPRLIGPLVTTRLVEGKSYFIGPYYYYILAILGIITSWDVLNIVKILLGYWWITGIALFLWIGKKIGWLEGVLSYGLFSVLPVLIGYSRMFLNPNFLILISTGFFYFLWQAFKTNKLKYWILTGLVCGIGFSFHYICLMWMGIIGLALLKYLIKDFKLGMVSGIAAGASIVIGDLPFVIFEARHDFYNLRTFLRLGPDPNNSGLASDYYIFAFTPLVFFAFAYLLKIIHKRFGKIWMVITGLLIVGVMFLKNDFNVNRGIGTPIGWTLPTMKIMAAKICQEKEPDFNVVSMVTSDVRAMDLRWLIERCGVKSLEPNNYVNSKVLYLSDYGDFKDGKPNKTWEFATFGYKEKIYEEKIGDMWFYKLQK